MTQVVSRALKFRREGEALEYVQDRQPYISGYRIILDVRPSGAAFSTHVALGIAATFVRGAGGVNASPASVTRNSVDSPRDNSHGPIRLCVS